ncbi:hypothetical protein BPORC_0875 [Bifidobacterium porcinum]|nr:hypothetical protein BPORC_0875 [Bifidobacterium porcinum]
MLHACCRWCLSVVLRGGGMGRLGVRKGWAWRRDVEIGVWYVSESAESAESAERTEACGMHPNVSKRTERTVTYWNVSKRAERTVTYWNVSKRARKYRKYRKIHQSVAMACSGMAIATD